MIRELFDPQSTYKKRVKSVAILWTLLIFIACFIPGNEIPNLKIPLIDKWVHFVLFGILTFLWLLSFKHNNHKTYLIITVGAGLLGWLVEEIQGALTFLGRSKDSYDIIADTIGALLGTILFYICNKLMKKNS